MARRNLGIIAISPSPDPISMAFNIASGAIAGISALKKMVGRGRREADILTGPQGAQTVLGDALDQLDDLWSRTPDSDANALLQIRNEQQRLARNFEEFTYQFPRAGPGARGTILGVQQLDGTWASGTAPNEGWLTRQLERWDRRIKTVMLGTENGFDWNRLVDLGFDVGERFLPPPRGGTEPYVIQGPQGPVLFDPRVGGGIDVWTEPPPPVPTTMMAPGEMPEWFYPVLIGGAVLLGGSFLLRR